MFSEVAPLLLIHLDALKECLEVSSTEALVVVPLNDLDKDGRPVLEGLGEDLEQVAVIVVIDENPQLLEDVDVFFDLHLGALEPLAQLAVIGVGNVQELSASVPKVLDALDDVVRPESNVLDSGGAVVIDVFLDL